MSRTNRVIKRDKGWRRIQRELQRLNNRATTAGVHEEDAASSDDVDNVEKAYLNEFGVGNRPTRSFLRATHDEKKNAWHRASVEAVRDVIRGLSSSERVLDRVGSLAAGDIKEAVVDFSNPPNALMTVRLKGKDDPLVDSGEMRDSIKHRTDS